MDERSRLIISTLAAGRLPSAIPDDCEHADELKMLAAYLTECYRFAMDISSGDFANNHVGLKGSLAGSLKTLQANLRHLSWQTKQVALGDLTQRVDFLGEFSASFNSMVVSLEEARSSLLQMSTHDALTGLYNRAYFDTELRRVACGRCFPISIIMADLNGLKLINDQQGHAAGDRLIQRAASLLQDSFRGGDVVARLGGDEFAVIMPSAPVHVALASLERICRQVAAINEEGCECADVPISIAFGCAMAQDASQLPAALKLADERMYEDKRAQKREQNPDQKGYTVSHEWIKWVRSTPLETPAPASQHKLPSDHLSHFPCAGNEQSS